MRTVTKKELAERIAEALGARRSLVKDVIQHFLDDIVDELARGNRLEFRDFGFFEVRTRKRRMARNPRTSESVPVPTRATVKFKVGRRMKRSVQNARPREQETQGRPKQPHPAAKNAVQPNP